MEQLSPQDEAKVPEILTRIAKETTHRGPWYIMAQRGSEVPSILETFPGTDQTQDAVRRSLALAAASPEDTTVILKEVDGLYVALTLKGLR